MGDKGIGFDRNIRLPWMDAAAAACLATDDPVALRQRLFAVVENDLASREGQLKTVRLLLKVWHGTWERAPRLREEALRLFAGADSSADRVWLHYGMTMLAFPFFRDAVAIVGKLSRYGDEVTTAAVRQRLMAERGEIAIIAKSTERALFFLRELGILDAGSTATSYVARQAAIGTAGPDLECWLLACTIETLPGNQVIADDLFRLPQLFPFRFTVALDDLRRSSLFEVQRQGGSWDLVRFQPRGAEPAFAR